jgi:hypothetical protein
VERRVSRGPPNILLAINWHSYMLLYFDTYITDLPRSINRKLERLLSDVRGGNTSYRTQRKVDIFKYTLASFAPLSWSRVVINVDGANESDVADTLHYAKHLFPAAQLASSRSDTGSKYSKVLSKYVADNPWVFFSPHNDHPYIGSELNAFNKLVTLAEEAEAEFNLPVMILYSHFTESVNSITPDQFLYGLTGEYGKVLLQTEDAYVVLREEIPLLSTHIIRARQLHDLMFDAGENRVITTECLGKYLNIRSRCIQIVPKVEYCRHYDGYMHTYSVIRDYVSADRVPPLFIPNGFFESDIRIKYGFDEYFPGWVNLNPSSKSYIFRRNSGTDIGDLLSKIPFFWKDRVSNVDINPAFVESKCKEIHLVEEIHNPWRDYSIVRIRIFIGLRKCRQLFNRSVPGLFISNINSTVKKTAIYLYLRSVYRKFLQYRSG